MEIIFASQNKNKVKEIATILGNRFFVKGLDEFIFPDELPETGNTLEENSLQKAKFVFEKTHCACFADDSGLEIEALGGRPGIFSARYAGEEKSAEANIEKVIFEMKGIKNRNARFRTVIAFVNGTDEKLFDGIVNGKILEEKKGMKGFGYDPIFQPDGFSKSFAEMELDEKNKISHRAKALEKLIAFLTIISQK